MFCLCISAYECHYVTQVKYFTPSVRIGSLTLRQWYDILTLHLEPKLGKSLPNCRVGHADTITRVSRCE